MYTCQHCNAVFEPGTPKSIARSHAIKVRNERAGEMVLLCPACASRLPKQRRFNPPQWIIRAALGLGYQVAIDCGGYWYNIQAREDGLAHLWRSSNSPAFDGCNAIELLTPHTNMPDEYLVDLCRNSATYVCA